MKTKTVKLTKFQRAVWDGARHVSFAKMATEFNRSLSAIEKAYDAARQKLEGSINNTLADGKQILELKGIDSDKRIEAAIGVLTCHQRGQTVLTGFRKLAQDFGANGLDTQGLEALVTLTKELAAGRRDFLYQLPK